MKLKKHIPLIILILIILIVICLYLGLTAHKEAPVRPKVILDCDMGWMNDDI